MSENKLYLIRTISSFVHNYAVRADSVEEAVQLVEDQTIEEMSQRHIGELTTDSHEIDEDEYIEIFDRENDYLSDWSRERKLSWIGVETKV